MVSATMIFPLLWAIYYGEKSSLIAFLQSMGVGSVLGVILIFLGRKPQNDFFRKEGLATVSFAWIAAGLIGALPFYFSNAIPSCIDAWFESVSGFTTTGSSILTQIESLPKSMLFWRSFTQWLGGMGIILLFIAIFPVLGIGSKQMYKMELPGVGQKNLVPEIKHTAIILWSIYLALTFLEIISLKIAGMSFYDSFCHTFATLATGGFSTKNASIAHYGSFSIESIIMVFMLLAGINFALYFWLIRGSFKTIYRDAEFRVYIGILIVATLLIAFNLIFSKTYSSVPEALRYSGFQVLAMQTTTGFVTADFNMWPAFSKAFLVLLMIIGASTGSTGGGSKVLRVMLLVKYAAIQIQKFIRPNVVKVLKIGNTVIEDDTKDAILGFYVLFMLAFIVGTLTMTALGLDIITASTSVIATMWNIGPGLAKVGAIENFAFIHPFGKLMLSFGMIMGRLELYTLLVILLPRFWRE